MVQRNGTPSWRQPPKLLGKPVRRFVPGTIAYALKKPACAG